jgi:curved DNA-binding protein CbpA
MKALNPFQLLGVTYEATDQDVRNSFAELSKKTHPDRFAQYESERGRALASEMFVLVREAYGKIGDRASRLATAAKLRPATEPAKPAAATEAGKTLARVAVVSVAKDRPQPPPIPPGVTSAPPPKPPAKPAGLSHDDLFGDLPEGATPGTLRGASPVQLESAGSVGEGERLLAGGQHDQALAVFESALRTTPGDRAARIGRELALGLRLVATGDRASATQHFETVLELDPLHELASRELAAIRRAFTESRKGVLNKLLGRKT